LKKGMKTGKAVAELDRLVSGRDVALGKRLRSRVRCFTDGAVIGSRGFIDGMFEKCRDGARKLRGKADGAAAGLLWSLRDLRIGSEYDPRFMLAQSVCQSWRGLYASTL
jgi:hypothetical protein